MNLLLYIQGEYKAPIFKTQSQDEPAKHIQKEQPTEAGENTEEYL